MTEEYSVRTVKKGCDDFDEVRVSSCQHSKFAIIPRRAAASYKCDNEIAHFKMRINT